MKITVRIPTLRTDRLLLRAPRVSDFQAVCSFYQSSRSAWIGGPKSAAEAAGIWSSSFGAWMMRGYGLWHIEDRSDRSSVGNVGFFHPLDLPEPELGWHIYDGFESKGYAHEAALAVRHYGAQHLGLDNVISYIAHDNARSAALAERLGAWHEADVMRREDHCRLFRHPVSLEVTEVNYEVLDD